MSDMERIASFSVDHIRLLRGLYVSRKDPVGDEWITTFDIRMKEPNREPGYGCSGSAHPSSTWEPPWLRNNEEWSDRIIYFGPMGCRTGCYLLMRGDLEPADILPLIRGMFDFIIEFKGDIPGAAPEECGNWLSQDLSMAVWESRKYIDEVLDCITDANLNYPS